MHTFELQSGVHKKLDLPVPTTHHCSVLALQLHHTEMSTTKDECESMSESVWEHENMYELVNDSSSVGRVHVAVCGAFFVNARGVVCALALLYRPWTP